MEYERSSVRISIWNTDRAELTGPKGRLVKATLAERDCDVLCVTECFAGVLPNVEDVIKGA